MKLAPHTPWATITLLGLIGFGFACQILVYPGPKNLGIADPGFLVRPGLDSFEALGGSAFSLSISAGEWWRLLTVMLLHGGATHLGLNALNAFVLCRQLEWRAGWCAVFAAFTATGVLGALASALSNHSVLSIGASGAVFGTLGFLVMVGVQRFAQAGEQLRRNAGPLTLAVGSSAIIPQVDNAAHIGGLLAGLALGFIWERLPQALQNALGALGAAALLFGAFKVLEAVMRLG